MFLFIQILPEKEVGRSKGELEIPSTFNLFATLPKPEPASAGTWSELMGSESCWGIGNFLPEVGGKHCWDSIGLMAAQAITGLQTWEEVHFLPWGLIEIIWPLATRFSGKVARREPSLLRQGACTRTCEATHCEATISRASLSLGISRWQLETEALFSHIKKQQHRSVQDDLFLLSFSKIFFSLRRQYFA